MAYGIEAEGVLGMKAASDLASLGLDGKLILRTTTKFGGNRCSRIIEVSRYGEFVARIFAKDLHGFLIGYAAAKSGSEATSAGPVEVQRDISA